MSLSDVKHNCLRCIEMELLKSSKLNFNSPGAFEHLFHRLPNHVITVKHKRKVPDVTAEQCARRCVFEQNFRCRGFDYEPGYGNCWLTDLTVAQSEGVKFHQGADFYEMDLGMFSACFHLRHI